MLFQLLFYGNYFFNHLIFYQILKYYLIFAFYYFLLSLQFLIKYLPLLLSNFHQSNYENIFKLINHFLRNIYKQISRYRHKLFFLQEMLILNLFYNSQSYLNV